MAIFIPPQTWTNLNPISPGFVSKKGGLFQLKYPLFVSTTPGLFKKYKVFLHRNPPEN